MNKYVFEVQERDANCEWVSLAVCSTLEKAKDYIRARTGPDFNDSADAEGRLYVYLHERTLAIVQKELIQ